VAGKSFVAGADIQFFVDRIRAGKISDIESFTRKGHELLLRLENCRKKTIALLDGLSLGGGSELALACQYIVATPSGSMGFPETGIGIVPGLGGMIRMQRHIGLNLAKYYVFTGQTLTARDAHALGIVYKVVSPDEIQDTIQEIMGRSGDNKYRERVIPEPFLALADIFRTGSLADLGAGRALEGLPAELADKTAGMLKKKSMIALKTADEVLNHQAAMSFPESVEYELSILDRLFSTHDALEGLSSAGRRKPLFIGQ
jgi:enoyl-CoA hydratase / 3-hydroxyacyl-CoA dehydrogenase